MAESDDRLVLPTSGRPVFLLFPETAGTLAGLRGSVFGISGSSLECEMKGAEGLIDFDMMIAGLTVLLPTERTVVADGRVKAVSGDRFRIELASLQDAGSAVLTEYLQLRRQVDEIHLKTYRAVEEIEASVFPDHTENTADSQVPDAARKILIVDDSAAIHERFRDIFEKNGFSVLQAVDGLSAIKRSLEERPDIILMDLNMPKMNGIESARVIRSNPATAHIPVCMFTTEGEKESVVRAIRSGVKDYIIKTMPPETVLDRVKAILGIS